MNMIFRYAFSLLAALTLLIAPADSSAIPAPRPAMGQSAPRAGIGVNPHLHGAAAIAHPVEGKGRPTEHPERPPEHPAHPGPADHDHHLEHLDRREVTIVHHVWSNRWDYVAWRLTHLHYGEIRGVVISAAGEPVRGAHVWLQQPSGKPFKLRWKKHATTTNAAGQFRMTHVLAQTYRLSTHHGHIELAVHAGTLTASMVRFE
jgi:hypothetical protein